MPPRIVKTPLEPGVYYLSGNEAAAEGALAAGCRFYAGYPITPSSEIMERMAERLEEVGGVFVQMEDEIGSICSALGAAWAGAKAMTATSGPGFSLMQEAIGYAAFTETPVVIIDVQRAGPATGQATRPGSGDIMQAKWGSHGDYQVVAFSPWSVQEMYELTIRAFNWAERLRVPAVVLADEAVGHLRERVELPGQVEVYERDKAPGLAPFGTDSPDGVPPMPCFGEGENLLVTGSTHDPWGIRRTDDPVVHERLVGRINRKVLARIEEIVDVEGYYLDEPVDVLVIAYGFTARSALFAVQKMRSRGRRVGMLRLKSLWPFPSRQVAEACAGATRVLVPEMNMGQVAGEVRKAALMDVATYNQCNGEVIEPPAILQEIERIL